MFQSASLAPLRNRDFRLLLGGQAISWMGNNFYEIAIMWLVLQLTGSTVALAGVAVVSFVPQMILTPFAGVVADRVNRRFLALSMDLSRGVVILVLPVLDVTHHLMLWQIYVCAFVLFSLFAFFIPARESILPNILPDEQLPAGNALFQAAMTGSLFAGFALGGVVVAAVGVVPALYIDSLSFAGSVGTLLLMHTSGRTAEQAEGSRSSPFREAVIGLQFIRRRPELFALLMFLGSTTFLVGPLIILPAPFARTVLHAGARGYGFLEASFMLGNFGGAIAAGVASRVKQVGALIIGIIIICGALLIGMSYMTVLALAIGFYFCIGLAAGSLDVPIITMMQRLTPDEMRGRVMSTMMLANTAGMPLSLAIGGAAAQPFGIPAIYRVIGILFVVTGLITILTPIASLQSVPKADPESVAEMQTTPA